MRQKINNGLLCVMEIGSLVKRTRGIQMLPKVGIDRRMQPEHSGHSKGTSNFVQESPRQR